MSKSAKKARPKKAPARKKTKAKLKELEEKAPLAEEKPKRAQKTKKPAEKKEAVAAEMAKTEAVKLRPPPTAMVSWRHLDSLHERQARGFSFGELASAGIPLNTAKSQALSIDIRRRSVRDENVNKLRAWFEFARDGSSKPEAKSTPAQVAARKR